jgi:hypothetical protein
VQVFTVSFGSGFFVEKDFFYPVLDNPDGGI